MQYLDSSVNSFTRFCVFAFAWGIIALLWPLTAWFELSSCERLWAGVRHQVTFTVIHFVAFPFAVGWVAVHAPGLVNSQVGRSRWNKAILFAMFALMGWVSYKDLTTGYFLTIYLHSPCTEELRIEDQSRSEAKSILQQKVKRLAQAGPDSDPDQVSQLTREVEKLAAEYSNPKNPYLSRRSRDGIASVMGKANFLPIVAALVTVTFQMFCAFLVWCVVLHFLDASNVDESVVRFRAAWLTSAIVAVCTWIPVRAYANYWEREYGMIPTNDGSVVFAAILALIVFFLLLINQLVIDWKSWEVLKYIAGVVCGVVGFLVSKFPTIGEQIRAAIETLTPEMLFTSELF
jgi:hypothetical protein